MTILVHDQGHKAVRNAAINGNWTGPYAGVGTCKTGTSGACSITVSVPGAGTETFTVSNMVLTGYVYKPANNHDATASNGIGNGAAISITGP